MPMSQRCENYAALGSSLSMGSDHILLVRFPFRFGLAILVGLAQTVGWLWLPVYGWQRLRMSR